jgi:hypothetical protein
VSGSFVGVFLRYMIPGILLLIIFALVIPGFWFLTVYLNRRNLDVSAAARQCQAGRQCCSWVLCWVVGLAGAAGAAGAACSCGFCRQPPPPPIHPLPIHTRVHFRNPLASTHPAGSPGASQVWIPVCLLL